MVLRTAMHKLACAVALIVIILAGLALTPFQATHAAAVTASANRFLPNFSERVDGQTFVWKEITPWYINYQQKRVDAGKWVVKEGRYALGTIEVGINEYTTGLGHPGFAIDTTTSIPGLGIPHEITIGSYPSEGHPQHESPFGYADSYYGSRSPFSIIESPTNGVFPYTSDEATGGEAAPMFNNMQNLINGQNHAYYVLENIYKLGAKGVTTGGNGQTASNPMSSVRPAFPIALFAGLTAAGALLGFSGTVVKEVCTTFGCGKHTKIIAMVGGIIAQFGTLLTIASGASAFGVAIYRASAGAGTQGIRAVAAALRMVQEGPSYAASRRAAGIPADIVRSISLPTMNAI